MRGRFVAQRSIFSSPFWGALPAHQAWLMASAPHTTEYSYPNQGSVPSDTLLSGARTETLLWLRGEPSKAYGGAVGHVKVSGWGMSLCQDNAEIRGSARLAGKGKLLGFKAGSEA